MKKNQGDTAPFKIATTIKNFLKKHQDIFILGWPGYIGKSTSAINNFYNEIVPTGQIVNGYFFQALNGTRMVSHPTTRRMISLQEYINELFGNVNCSLKKRKDHSKILAFIKLIDYKGDDISNYLLNDNYEVYAVMIGSSNQSENTYVKSPTPKGEADIFMIDTEVIINQSKHSMNATMIENNTEKEMLGFYLYVNDNPDEHHPENNSSAIVISKQIKGFNQMNSLKEIVKELIQN